jgi:hypothetical protein
MDTAGSTTVVWVQQNATGTGEDEARRGHARR